VKGREDFDAAATLVVAVTTWVRSVCGAAAVGPGDGVLGVGWGVVVVDGTVVGGGVDPALGGVDPDPVLGGVAVEGVVGGTTLQVCGLYCMHVDPPPAASATPVASIHPATTASAAIAVVTRLLPARPCDLQLLVRSIDAPSIACLPGR
jgi:hypothetical protein